MSFDRERLADRIATQGRVARVVVATARGSVPREAGASMLVWDRSTDGTIGGGTLEWEAIARARDVLRDGADRLDVLPLGPALAQCCGGQVTLVTEIWDAARLSQHSESLVVRPVPGGSAQMPLAVRRLLAKARAEGATVGARILDGWLIEPVTRPSRPLWIYGAGHVGHAIAAVLSPLPEFDVVVVDDRPDRMPQGVTPLVAANPADAVAYAPGHAEHLVLTYSHALDLEICHRILGREFRDAGLIGSATKWARFRKRLGELGHAPAQIARIRCPIGEPALGKHPQAIAVSVAAQLLRPMALEARKEAL